ncbi:MAG: hypothetical protein ACYYKD_09325 [Rhodospirillales bacterium]
MGYKHRERIIKIAIKAMTKMAKRYSEKWTSNYPWDAPEYLFTVAISQALMDEGLWRVYPENNVRWSITESRSKKITRFKQDISKLDRSDIMIADGNDEYFRFCIEVKKHGYALEHIANDLKKCADIISVTDPGTIDDAIVVFFKHGEKTKANPDNVTNFTKFIRTTLVGRGQESKGSRLIKDLEDRGFRLEPYIGKFQTFSWKGEGEGEGEGVKNHEYDWVVGAIRISMPVEYEK